MRRREDRTTGTDELLLLLNFEVLVSFLGNVCVLCHVLKQFESVMLLLWTVPVQGTGGVRAVEHHQAHRNREFLAGTQVGAFGKMAGDGVCRGL